VFIYYPAERLSDLAARFPKINELFRRTILDANLSAIKSREFKARKDRLIIADALLAEAEGLDRVDRLELIQLILDGDFRGADSTLDRLVEVKPKQGIINAIRSIFYDFSPGREGILKARDVADRTSDIDFLSRLNVMSTRDAIFRKAVADVENLTQKYFDTIIAKLLKKVVPRARLIQEEELGKLIKRRAYIEEERDLSSSRTSFMHQIEERSQSESSLYVWSVCLVALLNRLIQAYPCY